MRSDRQDGSLIRAIGSYEAESVTVDHRRNAEHFGKLWDCQVRLVGLFVRMRAPIFYLLRGEHLAQGLKGRAYRTDRPPEAEIRKALYDSPVLPGITALPSTRPTKDTSLDWTTRHCILKPHEVIAMSLAYDSWHTSREFGEKHGLSADEAFRIWLIDHLAASLLVLAAERTLGAKSIPAEVLSEECVAAPESTGLILAEMTVILKEIADLEALVAAANMKLLISVVAGMPPGLRHDGVNDDDMIGYGAPGLLDAIAKYDPRTGIKFATFAWGQIEGGIKRHIENCSYTIRIPNLILQHQAKIRLWLSRNEYPGQPEPTPQQVCVALHLTKAQYDRAMGAKPAFSLDAPKSKHGDETLHDLTTADDDDSPAVVYEQAEIRDVLKHVYQTTLETDDRLLVSFLGGMEHSQAAIDFQSNLGEQAMDVARHVYRSMVANASLDASPPIGPIVLARRHASA